MSAYETDPEWLAAKASAEAPLGADETPADGLLRRTTAYFRMFQIESAEEADA